MLIKVSELEIKNQNKTTPGSPNRHIKDHELLEMIKELEKRLDFKDKMIKLREEENVRITSLIK